MSRTYKLHKHIAGRDKQIRVQNKHFVSGSRSKVKSILNSITDQESADNSIANFKYYKSLKKSSSGYFDFNQNIEAQTFKHYKEVQSHAINGASVSLSFYSGSIDHQIAIWYVEKHSITLPKIQDVSNLSADDRKTAEIQFESDRRKILEDYYAKALVEISDEELKKIIHTDCAKKGENKMSKINNLKSSKKKFQIFYISFYYAFDNFHYAKTYLHLLGEPNCFFIF